MTSLAPHSGRSGLRFLEADAWFPERHLYRLAVEGAEGLYGMAAPNPLFFTWTQDPLAILNKLRDSGSAAWKDVHPWTAGP